MLTETASEQLAKAYQILKEVFGFNAFRGEQSAIINNLLEGRNTFVIMPTGAGKSLCYQLPALVKDGTAVIISPLIALMKNQVDQLNGVGVNAQFLNSTLSKSEMTRVKKEVLNGIVKLLYVAPESLTKDENILFLQKANVSFFAIDEAHCISEWGHDFRPEYRRIRSIVENLGNQNVIALTATATPKVQLDIMKNLQMEDASLFKGSFNRPNLYYEIRPKVDTKKQIIKFIKNRKGQSGIIYCLSRKGVEELAEFLCVNDIKALPYHAGLDSSTRMRNQDAFLNEEVEVVVATIAFGMGIDKPDVRFVIHYDAPKSLEGYYQETGRAGRDGLEGHCLMFYAKEDISKLEKFHKDKSVTERENATHLLNEITDYALSSFCRRRQLLHYFGEVMAEDCGYCDNCHKPAEKENLDIECVLALKTVQNTEERFGPDHLVNVVCGIKSDFVESYNHDKLPQFGKGSERTPEWWYSLFRQLAIYNLLEKDIENYGVLKITEKGKKYIEHPYMITIHKDHDMAAAEVDKTGDDDNSGTPGAAYDTVLYELLKAEQKRVAKEKGVPPYVVFQENSLQEMANLYPTTAEQMAQIIGVGKGKVDRFGASFLKLIKKYVDENNIETVNDVIIKTQNKKSSRKQDIIRKIDARVNLEDIAEFLGIEVEEVIEEIESLIDSGTKLNLNYYINNILDKEQQKDIVDYFLSAELDSIEKAYEYFDEEFEEGDLRLMRIKFLSDYAN